MNRTPTVCNSSPLIALEQIGHLFLLRDLFDEVLVPVAVVSEVPPTTSAPSWIVRRPCTLRLAPHLLSPRLGAGECEAISLAVEVSAARIILDDRPARRTAQALGLTTIGTLGILLAAKRKGFIPAIRPLTDALGAAQFRASAALIRQLLVDAGE
jgi:predicted nucleic acid-binding protein